jgi:hypothetical protein
VLDSKLESTAVSFSTSVKMNAVCF